MAAAQTISDAEWQIMHLVWDRQPVLAQDVIATLNPHTGWSPATIRTMLHRLVKKNVLAYRQEGNRYLYRSRLRRADCLRRAVSSFVERVFDGEAAPMLAQFVRNVNLTADEIEKVNIDVGGGKKRFKSGRHFSMPILKQPNAQSGKIRKLCQLPGA